MLPKNEFPTYSFVVPSTQKSIQFRPFLRKDKKLLLIALENKDAGEIVNAVKQVLTNCVLDPKFDIDSLASFDIEMFFLNLRARSDSEIVEATYKCDNVVDDKPCGAKLDIVYNLLEQKLTTFPEHTKTIMLGKDTGVVMKYPTFTMLQEVSGPNNQTRNPVDVASDFITDCIDYVFDKENIHKFPEFSRKELEEYLDTLTTAQYAKIEQFIDTMPVLKHVVAKDCPKCKHHHVIEMEGLPSFFDL